MPERRSAPSRAGDPRAARDPRPGARARPAMATASEKATRRRPRRNRPVAARAVAATAAQETGRRGGRGDARPSPSRLRGPAVAGHRRGSASRRDGRESTRPIEESDAEYTPMSHWDDVDDKLPSRYTSAARGLSWPAFSTLMDYAIIRAREQAAPCSRRRDAGRRPAAHRRGEELRADVLLGDAKVTATVLAHARGPKILDRQVPQAHRLQAPQRLPRRDHARRDLRSAGKAAPAKAAAAKAERSAEAARGCAEAAPRSRRAADAERLSAKRRSAARLTGSRPVEQLRRPRAPRGLREADCRRRSTAGAKDVEPTPELEAALAYEQAHAARKGALARSRRACEGERLDGA